MSISEFWRRISEILLLISPVLFLLFGVNLEQFVGLVDALIIAIGPVILIIKNIIDLVSGWFKAKAIGHSFKDYRSLGPIGFRNL